MFTEHLHLDVLKAPQTWHVQVQIDFYHLHPHPTWSFSFAYLGERYHHPSYYPCQKFKDHPWYLWFPSHILSNTKFCPVYLLNTFLGSHHPSSGTIISCLEYFIRLQLVSMHPVLIIFCLFFQLWSKGLKQNKTPPLFTTPFQWLPTVVRIKSDLAPADLTSPISCLLPPTLCFVLQACLQLLKHSFPSTLPLPFAYVVLCLECSLPLSSNLTPVHPLDLSLNIPSAEKPFPTLQTRSGTLIVCTRDNLGFSSWQLSLHVFKHFGKYLISFCLH